MKKEEKILLVRESINENSYPLDYEYPTDSQSSNCYSYAIGATFVESKYANEYIYNIGCMGDKKTPKNIKEAEEAFLADMEKLRINVKKTTLEEPIIRNQWKVAFFFDEWFEDLHDFHFARQNADGEWSHKEGINWPIRPLGQSPIGCTDMELVGYYTLEKA